MSDSPEMPAHEEVRSLLMGFVVSRAVQVAAELGVADALADGPKDREVLAHQVGADPSTLHRLIRACAGYGVFEELPDGRYANTQRSDCLRKDSPQSLRGLARMYGDTPVWQAWGGLMESVRSGTPSFAHVHGTMLFEYLTSHPDSARRFDEAMTSSSRLLNDAVVEAYDWAQFGTIVDVGGGLGSTLAAILGRSPRTQGVLFDLPHVIERSRAYFADHGIADRCRTESGNFFDSVPAGADVYFLKHIIHDWGDDDCVRILRNCNAAMPPHSTLVLCEKLIPPGNGPSSAKMFDIVMLAMTEGGRERSENEYRTLLRRADLQLRRVIRTGADNYLLEVTK